MTTDNGPRQCAPGFTHHDWRLADPQQEPPRTLWCPQCDKHVPPEPTDSDYDARVQDTP